MPTTDGYAQARRKLRSGTRAEAMRRMWEMAREGLAHRASMGVAELTYETDLIPGTRRVQFMATVWGVEMTVHGHKWGDKSTEYDRAMEDPITYRLDEAWLLDKAVPTE